MEEKNDITWERLVEQGNYLRSIGVPVDDREELARWIETYRRVLAMPDEEVQRIVERTVQKAIRQFETEKAGGLLAEVADVVRRFVIRLAGCGPLQPAFATCLAHLGDQTEGKEIPVPEELKEQLPWLDGLQIVVLPPGRASPESRRYKAKVRVREPAGGAGGSLRVALVGQDGARRECVLTPAEREIPFKADFSADWAELTVELVAEPDDGLRLVENR